MGTAQEPRGRGEAVERRSVRLFGRRSEVRPPGMRHSSNCSVICKNTRWMIHALRTATADDEEVDCSVVEGVFANAVRGR